MMKLAPGFHQISASEYHSDPAEEPSLSSSVAKVLLRDTPRHAWHIHPKLNPAFEPKNDGKFVLGNVAHELLLGRGGGFDVYDFADWRKGEAKECRDASWAEGRTPILAHQHGDALAIVEAVCERLSCIPECQGLFEQPSVDDCFKVGNPEVVMIWQDIGGALCRAMLDWWGPAEAEVWDVKTTDAGLSDAAIARTIVNLGYDLTAGFYKRGLEQLRPDLSGRLKWRWIFVEASEPFECRVIEADGATLALGDRKAALAIEKWRKCVEADSWPGYAPEITRSNYPEWAQKQWIERELVDDDSLRMIVTGQVVERGPQRLMEPV